MMYLVCFFSTAPQGRPPKPDCLPQGASFKPSLSLSASELALKKFSDLPCSIVGSKTPLTPEVPACTLERGILHRGQEATGQTGPARLLHPLYHAHGKEVSTESPKDHVQSTYGQLGHWRFLEGWHTWRGRGNSVPLPTHLTVNISSSVSFIIKQKSSLFP